MVLRKLLFILFVFLFSFSFSFGVDYTSCGQTINSGTNYVMTGDLTVSGGTCIDMFNVVNVIFDCNNYILNSSDGSLPVNIWSSVDMYNITLENCIFKDISNSPIRIFPGGFDTIENITFNNMIFFSSNNYGIRFEISSSSKINNVYLNNITLEQPVFGSAFHDLSSNFFIDGFFINNSIINSIPTEIIFNNSIIENSDFDIVYLHGENNVMNNLNLSVIGILVDGINNTVLDSEINQFYLQNQNNSILNNVFLDISSILITSSPNILSGNTYINISAGGSSICFFGGLVCDNSALIVTEIPGPVILSPDSGSGSVSSLPGFGFWSSVAVVVAVFVGLVF